MSNETPYTIPFTSKVVLAALVAAGFATLESLSAASDEAIIKVLESIDGCKVDSTLKAIRKAAPVVAPDSGPAQGGAENKGDSEPDAPAERRPCRFCKGESENCPYCTEDPGYDCEEKPASGHKPRRPGPLAGRELAELNLHETRGVAHELGLPGHQLASIGELNDAFENISRMPGGVEAIKQAIHVARPVSEEGLWTVALAGGVAHAVDPEGWFAAAVNADGSAMVRILAFPNLHNRTDTNGAVAEDIVLSLASLGGFIDRLQALKSGAEDAFEAQDLDEVEA